METGENSLSSGSDGRKRKVKYFYDKDVPSYYYGQGHAMKPYRIGVTHSLVAAYGLHKEVELLKPIPAEDSDRAMFHAEDYVAFLRGITPETVQDQARAMEQFNVGGDCQVFKFSYCQAYAGASIGCAVNLNTKNCDIAINWAGGHSHPRKCKASGFGYVNDIVLSILELLKCQKRVLYVDIDVHRGDGVEEAFYTTDRVMTVSFHQYGDSYFPASAYGDHSIGYGEGKYYSVNVPLADGIDDESFHSLFKPIVQQAMAVYDPEVVVLQCGADSLAGDQLGRFNLSVKGHAECVRYMRSFNVPPMLLGGGGFTLRNVAKCWCYETTVAVGKEIDEKIPQHFYSEYFSPDYSINVTPLDMKNKNSKRALDRIRSKVLENINKMPCAPSVQFQERPPETNFPEPFRDINRKKKIAMQAEINVKDCVRSSAKKYIWRMPW